MASSSTFSSGQRESARQRDLGLSRAVRCLRRAPTTHPRRCWNWVLRRTRGLRGAQHRQALTDDVLRSRVRRRSLPQRRTRARARGDLRVHNRAHATRRRCARLASRDRDGVDDFAGIATPATVFADGHGTTEDAHRARTADRATSDLLSILRSGAGARTRQWPRIRHTGWVLLPRPGRASEQAQVDGDWDRPHREQASPARFRDHLLLGSTIDPCSPRRDRRLRDRGSGPKGCGLGIGNRCEEPQQRIVQALRPHGVWSDRRSRHRHLDVRLTA